MGIPLHLSLFFASLAVLIVVVMLWPARQSKLRPVPVRVKPAPYIGPQTYKGFQGYECSYLEATPKGHLAWADILLGNLPLDEHAGYWHNTGHGSLVLQTAFTEVELAEMLNALDGINAEGKHNTTGASRYAWVSVQMDREHPDRERAHPYEHGFTIEVRGIPLRVRKRGSRT